MDKKHTLIGLDGIPVGLGKTDRAVGIGVSRLLDLCDEVLLAFLRLEGGEPGLLFGHLLARLGLRQRAGLARGSLGLLDLGPVARLLDLGLAHEARLQRVCLLLLLGGSLVGLGDRKSTR